MVRSLRGKPVRLIDPTEPVAQEDWAVGEPMQEEEFLGAIRETQTLGQYNAERARGIVHTPEWDENMAELQAAFDAVNPDFVEPRITRSYIKVVRSLEVLAAPDVEDQSGVG